MYIRSVKNQFQAKLHPSLDSSWLSEGLKKVEELLAEGNPIETWITYFRAFNFHKGIGSSGESDISKSESRTGSSIEPDLATYKRATEELYTPKRLRLGASLKVLGDGTDDTPMSEGYHSIERISSEFNAEADPETVKASLTSICDNWNKLAENVMRLEEESQGLRSLYSALKYNVGTSMGEMEDIVVDVEAKIHLVDSRLGEGSLDDVGNPISIWTAIGNLQGELSRLRKSADNVRLDLERQIIVFQKLEEEGKIVKGDLKVMETNLEKLLDQCKTNFSKIKTKLWQSSSGFGVERESGRNISVQAGTISGMLADLKVRVQALENNFRLGPDQDMFGGMNMSDPIDALQQRIIKMETTLEASLDWNDDSVLNRLSSLENQ